MSSSTGVFSSAASLKYLHSRLSWMMLKGRKKWALTPSRLMLEDGDSQL